MPPSNNMGAEITAPDENRCIVDWLAFTLKDVTDPREAIRLAGLSGMSFTEGKGGGMGYKSSLRCENIVVFYDGSDGMGCHISLTGQGCRYYEAYTKKSNAFYSFLHRIASINGKFTRFDIALDNVDGALHLDDLRADIEAGNVRTRFKSGQEIKNLDFINSPSRSGHTIYVGSKTSRLKIRFYDKAAQLGIDGHWTRCELQFMAERAQEFISHLLKGQKEAGDLAAAVLNQYFVIINKDDSNISRCTTKDWWAAWLQCTECLSITTAKMFKSVEQLMQYITKQYSASFAMIKKYLPFNAYNEFMKKLVTDGTKRLTSKHYFKIECSHLAHDLPF